MLLFWCSESCFSSLPIFDIFRYQNRIDLQSASMILDWPYSYGVLSPNPRPRAPPPHTRVHTHTEQLPLGSTEEAEGWDILHNYIPDICTCCKKSSKSTMVKRLCQTKYCLTSCLHVPSFWSDFEKYFSDSTLELAKFPIILTSDE